MNAPVTPGRTVLHLGPPLTAAGGVAAVLRQYANSPPDGFEPRFRERRTWLRSVRELARGSIVHVHLWGEEGVPGRGFGAALPGPVVATLYDGGPLGGALRGRATLSLLRRADAVVVPTEALARRLRRELVVRNVHVVPHPVALLKEATPVRRTEPVAVFAGPVSRANGAELLRTAWQRVESRVPGARLVLLGETRDKLGAWGGSVTLAGPQPHEAVLEWIERARVGVAATPRDGMPSFLLEVLARGRPVVAPDAGGIVETVGPGGVLVKPDDAGALEAGLVRLLRDEDDADAVGRSGRLYVARRNQSRTVAGQVAEIYGTLVAASVRPSRRKAPTPQ